MVNSKYHSRCLKRSRWWISKMRKYKVRVFTSKVEVWGVEAENEQEAMENYWEG